MPDPCFQIKGSAITTIVLELFNYSAARFSKQLHDKVAQAPRLFERAPVVISLEKLDENQTDLDFSVVIEICKSVGLQPMAFKGSEDQFTYAVRANGLPLLPLTSVRAGEALETHSEPADRERDKTPDSAPDSVVPPQTKVITQPIRSGQQIYAQGSDLIVMSKVSEGAEVLADGHIHIYGVLRGRALAGVKGNSEARIFCHVMEAELLSINGDFILSEDLRTRRDVWKQPAQVYRTDDSLHVDAL